MDAPRMNSFERYRPFRRRAEIAFWVVLLGLQAVFSIAVAVVDARSAGRSVAFWEVVTWELTSQLTMLALVPAVIAFERRFPVNLRLVGRNWSWHVLASVVFSVVHVACMVALRKGIYALAGGRYDFGDWLLRWPYEYFKDVRTYGLILLAILTYRLFMLRLQGEARVLDEPEDAPVPALAAEAPDGVGTGDAAGASGLKLPLASAAPARPERFLVRKLRREFLIAAGDIDWLQAQGNYVGLHVNGHDYLLRATLTDFLAQLDPARHVRVHRSYAVHLDRIAEIEPLDGGDARLHMRDGTHVPCSRRYRGALQASAGVVPAAQATATAPAFAEAESN
ncbi:LytTR family DNA-binding domain-containing protein [Variovorax sp. J22R133]|uniref:LytTR family DNA-binding domain-containing protein n=1 Tax=Variovorax brevis TaxID=3053503 RepID=UPI002577FBA6|nr:LytTR family DNA-binding domain-containing protein [Variovorax sp. J22R133]MDM0112063.1 LytTR family DNA-binding domain-containing protein [Variovorax sp. J22R133]